MSTQRDTIAGVALLAATTAGLIAAFELGHWKWALYGLLTGVFAALALVATKPNPTAHTPAQPPTCTFCGRPTEHTPP